MNSLDTQIAQLGDSLADQVVDIIENETRRIVAHLLEDLTPEAQGVSPDWMNELQEEIADVIETARVDPPAKTPAPVALTTASNPTIHQERPQDLDGNQPEWIDRVLAHVEARRGPSEPE